MNAIGKITAFFALAGFALALAFGFAVFWNTPTLQEARADAIRLQAAVDADRVKAQTTAEAQAAALATNADLKTQPAKVAGLSIAWVGLGFGLAIMAVSLAFAFGIWATTRAALIAPTAGGQFPMVRVGGFGWAGLIDPNKSTGLVALKTPTIFDVLVEAVTRARGHASALPAPEFSSPLALSESGTLHLTAQAAAVAMTAAATRHPESARAANVKGAVEAVANQTITLALPPIEDEDPDHIDRLLELTAGD